MSGLPEERIHGANFSSLLTREGKEQFPYLLRRALTSQVRAETALATAGKGAVRVLLSMSQISLDGGAGVCLVLTDLTDQKRAEDELRRLNTEMEHRAESYGGQVVEAHKELESFSYAVAHDLRAPLRHIHGFSEMLAHDMDTIFSADSRHYLERISSGVKRMEELISHLLNLSRVTRQPLSRQPTELGALLQDIINQSESEMNGRTIEWRIGTLPTWNCDPPLTRLVLLNLVSNAIKFTRGRLPAVIEIGEVLINGTSTVFVKDNGVGFNMKYAQKLFGLFQRLHDDKEFEGSGVGLATANRIVQRHGGRLWAEATVNDGATFYFRLSPGNGQTNLVSEVAAGDLR